MMRNKFLYTIGLLGLLSTSLFAGIGGPHGNIGNSGTDNNREICIYCHTPHAANSGVGRPVPLWNKPTTPVIFYMYGATAPDQEGQTMFGGTSTAKQPTDQSLACLSCHDGISAMDSVVNAPGSGRNDQDGIKIGGFDESFTYLLPSGEDRSVGISNANSNGYGDLRNDHPISIDYIPGKASLKPLNSPLTNWIGAKTVADLLRDGKVQCVSCHDVHNYTKGIYRRTSNDNSALCFGCHDK